LPVCHKPFYGQYFCRKSNQTLVQGVVEAKKRLYETLRLRTLFCCNGAVPL
jgi:hypothetical protein